MKRRLVGTERIRLRLEQQEVRDARADAGEERRGDLAAERGQQRGGDRGADDRRLDQQPRLELFILGEALGERVDVGLRRREAQLGLVDEVRVAVADELGVDPPELRHVDALGRRPREPARQRVQPAADRLELAHVDVVRLPRLDELHEVDLREVVLALPLRRHLDHVADLRHDEGRRVRRGRLVATSVSPAWTSGGLALRSRRGDVAQRSEAQPARRRGRARAAAARRRRRRSARCRPAISCRQIGKVVRTNTSAGVVRAAADAPRGPTRAPTSTMASSSSQDVSRGVGDMKLAAGASPTRAERARRRHPSTPKLGCHHPPRAPKFARRLAPPSPRRHRSSPRPRPRPRSKTTPPPNAAPHSPPLLNPQASPPPARRAPRARRRGPSSTSGSSATARSAWCTRRRCSRPGRRWRSRRCCRTSASRTASCRS